MNEKQSRRQFLGTLSRGIIGATTLPFLSGSHAHKNRRPNVLFFFTDDQHFKTIHALNNPEVQTPNLDRLVKEGLTFTRAHIMGGTTGAVCIPSRAMLMTGKSIFHLKNRGQEIPEDHTLLGEALQSWGYQTVGIGKWHNGKSSYARSFTNGGKIKLGGMSSHFKVPVFDFDPSGEYPNEKAYIEKTFSSELFSDEAIRFLENKNTDQPFFMYISFTAPHDPRRAPEAYHEMYRSEEITLPKNFMKHHPFDNGEMMVRDEVLAPFPRTPDIVREHIAAYYAMITNMDYHLGRVIQSLEERGLREDTLIVFAGDNGLAVGQHGLLGKQNLYEHSVRVPLIMSGPGIPQNTQTDALCYLNDIYPTLCDILRCPTPKSVESRSLLPIIRDSIATIRESVFYAYTHVQRGVRTNDNWKLIKYNVKGVQTTQLFNLNDDPNEISNLAEDARYELQRHALTQLLKDKMKYYGDFCDLDKDNWGLPEEVANNKKVTHLAVGTSVTSLNAAQISYTTLGLQALTDGVRGSSDLRDGFWVGIEGDNLDVVVDLGKQQRISSISIGFLNDQSAWIFLPSSIEFLVSQNGTSFTALKNMRQHLEKEDTKETQDYSVQTNDVTARYVRTTAKSQGMCPEWHPGYTNKAWLFADEIIVQ